MASALGMSEGKTRILFVGELYSSHALSWIDLLRPFADRFAIRGASIGPAGDAWFPVSTAPFAGNSVLAKGYRFFCRRRYAAWCAPFTALYGYGPFAAHVAVLASAIRTFRPHIVHTFGFTPGALLFGAVPAPYRRGARWVLHTWGGSDVAFRQTDPAWQNMYRRLIPQADVVLGDNEEIFDIFEELGAPAKRCGALAHVPGTGGVRLSDFEPVTPIENRERLLLWNKAYESQWSKGVSVVEGVRLAWDRIAPLQCVFTAADQEIRDHIRLLPEHIRSHITVHDRIPRDEMLALMRRASVVLAPSLVDGTPNTLFEAMAAGAVPIVSPLVSFSSGFMEGENVFYARNLYPNEIADALVKAFTSGNVSRMVQANREKVAQMADRNEIAPAAAALYGELANKQAVNS